ncbi:MAG: hypothetical protein ACR2PG_24970 [Hyphomicrobiaceae bacterium]
MDSQISIDGRLPVGGMGFAVGYAPGKGVFRVYLCLAAAVALTCGWFVSGSEIVLALALFFALTAYYFYPLVESDKVRLGAGEHGVFIEGFGIIPWRSIGGIGLSTYAVRSIEVNELNIKLSRALPNALIADWRSLPYHRLLMKLPWAMSRDNVVRINLEPFRGSPAEILSGLSRMRAFYGK